MKHKIQELISAEKLAKQEAHFLLEELSQVNNGKLSKKQESLIRCTKTALEKEYELRLVFINSLENLL